MEWHAGAAAEQLRQELESVKQQLQAAKESAAQDQAEQGHLQDLQQTRAQELNSAHAELERLRLCHIQELSSVKSELAEMGSQHVAQGAKLHELQQQHAEVQTQAQQASELAARLAEVQAEAAGLHATHRELTQQLATAQTRCEETQQQLASTQSMADKSRVAEQQASAELHRLQTEQAHAQHAKHELVSNACLAHLCTRDEGQHVKSSKAIQSAALSTWYCLKDSIAGCCFSPLLKSQAALGAFRSCSLLYNMCTHMCMVQCGGGHPPAISIGRVT